MVLRTVLIEQTKVGCYVLVVASVHMPLMQFGHYENKLYADTLPYFICPVRAPGL